jgi:hypothetical protein
MQLVYAAVGIVNIYRDVLLLLLFCVMYCISLYVIFEYYMRLAVFLTSTVSLFSVVLSNGCVFLRQYRW